jgi:hypothetical protein
MYGFVSLRDLLVCSLLLVLPLLAAADNPAAPPFKAFDQAVITHMERAEIYDGIAHYKYDAVVGPGEFDKIRIHRIVRESQPNRPSPDSEAVMLLPGVPNYFEMIFVQPLISAAPPRDGAITIYLAKNGVDVWGIDYAHALVPAETTDFAFMKDWGVAKDIAHIRTALHFARLTRWASGLGPGPLHVSGLSYGAALSYMVAAEEAPRPPFLRNVKTIIPIDMAVRYEDETIRAGECAAAEQLQQEIDSGQYVNSQGLFLMQFGTLALTQPDDPSPFFEGLTNHQAGLILGAAGDPPMFVHFAGAFFDEQGIPTGFRFTDERLWLDMISSIPPHYPMQLFVDLSKEGCADTPTPAHNPYRHIRIPVFYVGAAGGYGQFGDYTVSLTRSRDVQKLNVQLLPAEDQPVDFGHAEPLMGRDAQNLVWAPILNWIKAHR